MADNKVLVEFQIVQKGQSISVVQKNTEKLAKSTDKASASQAKYNKQQDAGYNRQKQGMIQTANSTKNFSKLAQSIDGVGNSLVGAYATVAANVFALSALFNALKTAAKFDQLKEGLDNLGTSSGRTLGIMAENLKEVTGNAISLEEAYRSAALGISGGFGGEELAGLAKIAKGAAQTLGRDLGDAFDRLTRGAIKLEPEILDELGIMVRLDDAVENYATVLGKAAGSLSQAERRQAFMNAILEQGTAKFGEIADEVDTNVFDRLAATFGDLTKTIFGFTNAIIGVPLGLLADNALLLGAALLGFGSTLTKQIVPGLANAGAAAQANAARLLKVAEASELAGETQKAAFASQIAGFKSGNKGLEKYRKRIIDGTASTNDFRKMQIKVNQSIAGYTTARTRGNNVDAVALGQRKTEAALLKEIILLEQGRAAANIKTAQAIAQANAATGAANAITLFTVGAQGIGAAFSGIGVAAEGFKDELVDIAKGALPKGTKELSFFNKMMINSQVRTFKFTNSLRLLGSAFLGLLPFIAAFLAVAGLATLAFNKLYNTKEQKAFLKGQKELNLILSKLPEKAKEYESTQQSILPLADIQIKQFDIISNSISEINTKLKEQIRLEKAANESRKNSPGASQNKGLSNAAATASAEAIFVDAGPQTNYSMSSGPYGGMSAETVNVVAQEQAGLNRILGKGVLSFEEITKAAAGFTDTTSQQASLAQLFEIKDSDAFKSFSTILQSTIPRQAEILKNELNLEEVIGKGGQILEEDLVRAIDAADRKTKLLNDNFRGVNQTLAESEKATSKFIKALAPKTSVDAISLQFQSLNRELIAAAESTELAGLTTSKEIGRALSDTGTNVARLVGPKFVKQLTAVKDLEKQIKDARIEGVDGLKLKYLEDQLDKQLEQLGDQKHLVKETFDNILNLQKTEITRKNTLEQINKLLSKGATFASTASESAKIQLNAQQKQFDLRKEQLKQERTLLEKTFVQLKDSAGGEVLFENFKNMEIEDQLKIAEASSIELNNVFALQNQNLKDQNLIFEEAFTLADRKNQVEAMTQKALLEQVQLQKQLNSLTNQNLESEAKIEKFKRTGDTTLNAAETYDLQVAAAKKALDTAKEEAKIKNKLIDAELAVQKVRLVLLAAEAEAAEMPFDTAPIIKAMDKAAELKKDINDAGVTAAENTLALTVAEGLKKGIE